MSPPNLVFDKKGFPIIKIYDNYFEIKSTDHWEFRSFDYCKIKEIKYYNPNNNWYTKLLILFSGLITKLTAQREYRYLKLFKTNNGYWKYILPGNFDEELIDCLKLIEYKIGKSVLKIKE